MGMIKSLYGLFKSAILFYNNLVKNLEYPVPKTNTYDPCVLNEIINGQHITVTWRVYDLKVSHKYPVQNTKFKFYISLVYVR